MSVRLDPDVRAALDAYAEAEERSLSQVINRALREYVADRQVREAATPAHQTERREGKAGKGSERG